MKLYPVPSVAVAIIVSLFATGEARAASETWTGSGANGNWTTTGNWTSSIVPGTSGFTAGSGNGDTATFSNNTANSTVAVDANRNLKSIAIGGTGFATSYSFTGGPLLLSSTGTLSLGTTAASNLTQTFGTNIVLEPGTATAAGSYAFVNNSADSSDILNVTGNISAGTTTNAVTLTLGGSNTATNTISGALTAGGATNGLNLTKSGASTWALSGTGSSIATLTVGQGSLNLTGGTLSATSTIVGNAANTTGTLAISGGTQTLGVVQLATTAAGVTGIINQTGGTVNATSVNLGQSSGAGAMGQLNISGGTFNITSTATGALRANNAASEITISTGGTLNLAGPGAISSVSAGSLTIADSLSQFNAGTQTIAVSTGAAGTITNYGTFIAGTVNLLSSTDTTGIVGNGTLNLDGGTFTTTSIVTKSAEASQTANVNFNGGTLVYGGTTNATILASNSGPGPASILSATVQSGGALINTGTGSSSNTVTISQALTHDATLTSSLDGGLTKSGSEALLLSALNTYNGATTVNAGVLTAGIAQSGSAGAFGTNSAVVLANTAGVALNLNNFNETIGSLTGGGAAGGNVTLGSAVLTVGTDNTSPAAYAGVISGTGSVVKTGTGTEILTGASTYSGATTIDGGTLNVGTLAAVNTASSIGKGSSAGSAADLVFGGGKLQYTQTTGAATTNRLFTIGDANGNTASISSSSTVAADTLSFTNTGAVAFGNTAAHTLTLTGSNTGNNTLALSIGDNTGATSLVKSGAGTWLLTNNSNSYTGGTTITGGVLESTTTHSLGSNSGALKISGGGTLDIENVAQTVGLVNLGTTSTTTGSTIQSTGGTNTLATSGVTVDGSGNVIASSINLTGAITQDSNSGLTVNGTIASDTLNASGATLGGSGTVTGLTDVTSGTINGSGLALTGGALFHSTGNTLSGTETGTVSLAASAAGTQSGGTLTGNLAQGAGSSFTANGTITGTDTMSSGASLAGTGAISGTVSLAGTNTLSSTGTLTTGGLSVSGTGNQISSGTVAGGGTINSGGALTVSNGATWKGASFTDNGALVLASGSNVSGTGALAVSAGAVLAGSGTSSTGSFSVTGDSSTRADVLVGHTAGSTNTTGQLTLQGTTSSSIGSATLEFNLNAATPGESNVLAIGNTAVTFNTIGTLNTQLALTLVNASITSSTSYLLISGTASSSQYSGFTTFVNSSGQNQIITGAGYNVAFSFTNGTYGASYLYVQNDNIFVDVLPATAMVPEPGTWALILSGLALLVVIQRSRSKNSRE
jgi:fibronectin-binding autotransporter adhesin